MSNDCKHHWKIDSPSGPMAHGRCKLCGEERDFDNSYLFEKIGRKGRHKAAVSAGIRSVLGPNALVEAAKE